MNKTKMFLQGIAALLVMSGLSAGHASAQTDWKLKKKDAGIEVYVRDVPGSKLMEFRGTMTLPKTSLSSLLAAFDDPSTYTGWMYEVIEAKLLKKVNRYERISYTLTRAPWPVWNRDLVSHAVISQDPKTLTVTIRLTGLPDYIPAVPKTIRVPKMSGQWIFQPLDAGDVMVTYQMHNKPGGDIPPGMANMAVVDLPYNTLFRLRDFIKQEKYVTAVYPQIREPKRRK